MTRSRRKKVVLAVLRKHVLVPEMFHLFVVGMLSCGASEGLVEPGRLAPTALVSDERHRVMASCIGPRLERLRLCV